MPVLISMHLLSAVIWVGGMFFAYQILRPVAARKLEPPERLTLWSDVLTGFFTWVWLAIALLLVSGYAMIVHYGGFAQVGIHIHLMHGLGWIMMLIFAHVFFAPKRRLTQAVFDHRWPDAANHLAQIRKLVGLNLILGLTVVVIAGGGRFWVF